MIYKTIVVSGMFLGSLFSDAPVSETSSFENKAGTCGIENKAFDAGESLTYKVYYNAGPMWLTGGEIYFKLQNETYNGKQVYHGISEAVTYKSFDWFFKIRDKFETWMDVNTLQSYKFQRDIDEGGYTFFRSYDWNRSTNEITSYYHNTRSGKKKTTILKNADPCGVDMLSSFYWARTIDFTKYKTGDLIPVSMAIDDKIYNVNMRYEGKEQYKTKLGTFNTFKVRPLLTEGTVLGKGEGLIIWVTDDQNRIPVRIESNLKVGRITADLKSFAGNKYPFTSKVE